MARITTAQVRPLPPRGQGDHAPSAAAPVLFLHGWMTSGAVFDAVLARMAPAGRRLLCLDQRGAGSAVDAVGEHGSWATGDYGADVIALLDELGIDRVVLVGHSMGGQLALWLGACHPERVTSICAITPVPLSGLSLPAEARALFGSSAGNRDTQRTILQMATLSLSPPAMEHLLDAAATVSAACIVGALHGFTTGAPEVDVGRIQAPTLVVATDDPFLPLPFLQHAVVDRIPGARLHHLPGAGHYPTAEAPIEMAAIIDGFLASL
jgi:non-heme chloroperoxidase